MTQKRIVIDLYKCDQCKQCDVKCDYWYRPHASDHGILALREMVTYLVVCRRCENPNCVAACRFEALERQPEGHMQRYNLRCVSCKSCVQACPFGTIYPDTVPYYTAKCNLCVSRIGQEYPICIVNCKNNAIEYKEVRDSESEGLVIISEYLAVRAPQWVKESV
ncbi:4Fe-4S binding protein [bacterium]|nr:4Fe-4S binding protein [bacterium]